MEKTVYFRAFEPDDAALIHEWKNSDELNELTVGLNKKTCYEEDLEWVKSKMNHHPYYAYWAICDRESDKMIGWICLTDIHYINSSANFSGIVIGDKDRQDGLAWIESFLFVAEYVFERLNLNRMYGSAITEHKSSILLGEAMFEKLEGVQRQAVYKNGRYYDVALYALLRDEYFAHKEMGDYELISIIRRIGELRKNRK